MKLKGTYKKDGVYFRICGFCKKEKELNNSNFHKDESRKLGFMFECKECSSMRIDIRKHRFRKLNEDQRNRINAKRGVYFKTPIGIASKLAYSYKKIDKKKGLFCNITKEYILNNILTQPCYYCDDSSKYSGCDRVDNKTGHTINNVVPCCKECNTARMDNFTHEEMKIIGKSIAEVKRKRLHFQLASLL